MINKIKRIIAREGLIILGFIVATILYLIMGSMTSMSSTSQIDFIPDPIQPQSSIQTPYTKKEIEQELIRRGLKKSEDYAPKTSRVSDASQLTDEQIKQMLIARGLRKADDFESRKHEIVNFLDVRGKEIWYNDIKPTMPFILIFGYPFYLIMRFVIWAIRTLKKHESVR